MAKIDLFYKYVKYPVITEKSVLIVEKKNKITLVVDKNATKKDVKTVVKEHFNVDVKKVNILITPKGEKKAIVTLKNHDDTMKIATALGIL